jgi:hypothetical protein
MKWPKSIKELPTEPTYVIVEIDSVSYDDPYGQRGSGSTCTTYYPTIITFDNEQEWLEEIIKRMDTTRPYYQKKEFKAYKMMPAEIKLSVNVEVKEWQS